MGKRPKTIRDKLKNKLKEKIIYDIPKLFETEEKDNRRKSSKINKWLRIR